MKKTLAFVALLATALTMATAKGAPVFFAHGFVGYGLGATWGDGSNTTPAGYTASNPFGDNLSFGGGAALNIAVASIFGISVGADFSYNQIGLTVTNTNNAENYTQARFSYPAIDIPVMITARYNKFNFAFGPNFSIPLSGTYYTKAAGYLIGNGESTAEKVLDSKFVVGLNIAAGYEQRIGMLRGVVGVRYLLDFMPITTKTTVGNTSTITTWETRRALNVDLGVKVPLKF